MKNYRKSIAVIVAVFGVLISLSGFAQQKTFKVNVKWQGGNGKFVVLTNTVNGLPVTLDSARIVNDVAVLQMPASELFSTVYIGVNGNYYQDVLVYPGVLAVEITNDNSPESVTKSKIAVKGGLEQDLYQESASVFNTGLMTNMARSRALKTIGTKENMDSIINSYKPKFDSLTHVQDYVTVKYGDKDIAGYLLSKKVAFLPIERREKEYNNLSDRVKKGPYGRETKEIMISVVQRQVGQPAFNFTAKTMDNKEIKLSDYKGKYVLLDFWSSTCGPCLRMAPYMKKLYDTYRDKGFEIIAVSLDTKREDWVRAQEKHGISGVQVSSLKGADDPIAKYYGIFQMPSMILIDNKGNNAGKVEPQALDAKLAELFDKG